MERFFDPLHGGVYLDDQPGNEMNVQESRKTIALVSQEPVRVTFLFNPSRSGVLIEFCVRRRFTMILFASTLVVSRRQRKRSRRRSSRIQRLAAMPTSCRSSRACLSTWISRFISLFRWLTVSFSALADTDVGSTGAQLSGGQRCKFAHLIVCQSSCTDG